MLWIIYTHGDILSTPFASGRIELTGCKSDRLATCKAGSTMKCHSITCSLGPCQQDAIVVVILMFVYIYERGSLFDQAVVSYSFVTKEFRPSCSQESSSPGKSG